MSSRVIIQLIRVSSCFPEYSILIRFTCGGKYLPQLPQYQQGGAQVEGKNSDLSFLGVIFLGVLRSNKGRSLWSPSSVLRVCKRKETNSSTNFIDFVGGARFNLWSLEVEVPLLDEAYTWLEEGDQEKQQ
jgi:hypothetical protein